MGTAANRSLRSLTLVLVLGGCERSATPDAPKPETRSSMPGAPATTKPVELRESPKLSDIQGGAREGMRPVLGCIQAARKSGELSPGLYTLNLDWEILPTGAVANSKMTGPAELLDTSLPACFARGMDEWIFPPTTRGGQVRDFPFGPFEVK